MLPGLTLPASLLEMLAVLRPCFTALGFVTFCGLVAGLDPVNGPVISPRTGLADADARGAGCGTPPGPARRLLWLSTLHGLRGDG